MATPHLRFPPSSTSTPSNVGSSITVVTLLVANVNRLGVTIVNDGNARLRVRLGTGASLTNFDKRLRPQGDYEVPFGYTGIITGIWEQVSGVARVAEFTA